MTTAPDPQNVGNPQNVGFWKIRAVLPMTPPNHAKMHLTSYLDITYGIWKCSANLIKKFGTLAHHSRKYELTTFHAYFQ